MTAAVVVGLVGVLLSGGLGLALGLWLRRETGQGLRESHRADLAERELGESRALVADLQEQVSSLERSIEAYQARVEAQAQALVACGNRDAVLEVLREALKGDEL